MTTSFVDVPYFEKYGYLLVKNVFSKEEIAHIREKLAMIKQKEIAANTIILTRGYTDLHPLGDPLSKLELRDKDYVIFDDRVLHIVRQVLGEHIIYFGESTMHFGQGARGFHKDNPNRSDPKGPDWQGKYNVIRVGLYLQDHSHHSGGLKVRKKSHFYFSRHRGRAVNIPSEEGDVVLWTLRTSHSGNNVRLKGLPHLCFPPRIETRIPHFLRIPEEKERMVIFCAFAAPGEHAERFINYGAHRYDYCEHFRRSRFDEEVIELAKRKKVELRRPIPEYGSLYNSNTPREEPVWT